MVFRHVRECNARITDQNQHYSFALVIKFEKLLCQHTQCTVQVNMHSCNTCNRTSYEHRLRVPADLGGLQTGVDLGADEGHHAVAAVHEQLAPEVLAHQRLGRLVALGAVDLRRHPHRRAVLQELPPQRTYMFTSSAYSTAMYSTCTLYMYMYATLAATARLKSDLFGNLVSCSVRVACSRQVDEHGTAAQHPAPRQEQTHLLNDGPELTARPTAAGTGRVLDEAVHHLSQLARLRHRRHACTCTYTSHTLGKRHT